MKPSASLAWLLCLAAPLSAQTTDTLGGTNTGPTQTNTSKANLFRVDTSRMLFTLEMHLNVPGPETLTFFILRHHSRNGVGNLMWTHPVQVNGTGVGPTWYSSGPITVPLLGGNHYLIGVAWSGSVTYYYNVASSAGTPVSFGHWVSGKTPRNPPPATFSFTGVDIAQYYQRLTTFPYPQVGQVGTGCAGSAAMVPRLVASAPLRVGAQSLLETVDAADVPAIFALAAGPALATPIPVLGCDFWLPNVHATFVVPVSGSVGTLPVPVPNDTNLVNLVVCWQTVLATPGPGFTNALQTTIQ